MGSSPRSCTLPGTVSCGAGPRSTTPCLGNEASLLVLGRPPSHPDVRMQEVVKTCARCGKTEGVTTRCSRWCALPSLFDPLCLALPHLGTHPTSQQSGLLLQPRVPKYWCARRPAALSPTRNILCHSRAPPTSLLDLTARRSLFSHTRRLEAAQGPVRQAGRSRRCEEVAVSGHCCGRAQPAATVEALQANPSG
jgi:hypothetical protein